MPHLQPDRDLQLVAPGDLIDAGLADFIGHQFLDRRSWWQGFLELLDLRQLPLPGAHPLGAFDPEVLLSRSVLLLTGFEHPQEQDPGKRHEPKERHYCKHYVVLLDRSSMPPPT